MNQPEQTSTEGAPPSRKKALIWAGAAVVAAAAAWAIFILPAEKGIDPTGLGQKTGLTELSGDGKGNIYLERGLKRKGVVFPLPDDTTPDEAALREALAANGVTLPADAKLVGDHWEVELAPYTNIEMKYRLAQGRPMIFSWRATAPVHVDMHSVPDDGGDEATESFVIEDAKAAQSSLYVAPFDGIHGWYWQNRSLEPVTVTVDAQGAIEGAVTFDQGGEKPRELTPPSN